MHLGTCLDEVELDNSFTCDCGQVAFEGANCEIGMVIACRGIVV